MATISNTISLNDDMSPVINAITTAITALSSAFQQMQALTGNSINLNNINAAQNAINQTENAQNDLNQSIQHGSGAADELWGKLKGLIAAYVGWNAVSQTVAWSDEMTNIQARISMINDGTRTNAELMKAIYQGAQNSHASFQGMADLVGKLGNNAREAFSSNSELLSFAEQLNKQFTISGAGANEAQMATIQLVQGLSSGVLRGEELNSIFEQAPTVIRSISEYLGVGIGEIRALASEGKLTADVVKNALLGAAEETNKKFNEMPLTFSAAWTMAKNTAQMNMLGLQKVLENTFNSGQFQAIMDNLSEAFAVFIKGVEIGVKGLVSAVSFLYENWSLIAPVIGSVIAALLIYKSVMIGINAVEMISKGIKIASVVASYALAAARGTVVAATTAATAAQIGLNAAMLASPVTWIIASIIAIVGLLYLTIAVINKVTGESYSATGIIAGIAWGLVAYIRNIIGIVWNTILSLAEFFINVWQNPIYSVQKLIYNLAKSFSDFYVLVMKGIDPVVTSLAEGILWAVNKGIQGLNWLSSALDSVGLGWGKIGEMIMEETYAHNAESETKNILAALNPGSAPGGYVSLDSYRMNMADPAEYAAKGYNAGAKFAEDPMAAIKDALSFGESPAIQQMLANQEKQLGTQKQIADNTSSKPEEDYKYLKEVMAGRAIDRLSGTDIKIQMNNSNRINSALDLDNIVNVLANKLTSAMDSAAEGVHI